MRFMLYLHIVALMYKIDQQIIKKIKQNNLINSEKLIIK